MTKVQQTRAALMCSALELFAEHGYDRTTAAAISARAGVTEMTFFRYFPSKSAVLLSDPYDPLIVEAIIEQPAELPPLIAAISGVAASWSSMPAVAISEVRDRLRIVSKTPSLRGAIARNNAATEAAIAMALSSRGVANLDARIAAAATMAGLSTALLDWADSDDPDLGSAIEAAHRALGGERG